MQVINYKYKFIYRHLKKKSIIFNHFLVTILYLGCITERVLKEALRSVTK